MIFSLVKKLYNLFRLLYLKQLSVEYILFVNAGARARARAIGKKLDKSKCTRFLILTPKCPLVKEAKNTNFKFHLTAEKSINSVLKQEKKRKTMN